jgi:hypothetical protein
MNARHSPISKKMLAVTSAQAHYDRNARQARSDSLVEAVAALSRLFREVVLASVNRFKLYASRVPMPAHRGPPNALRRVNHVCF